MSATPAALWPQPIPILGLTGEYQSGKTWFGISICPDPKRLRVYDFELSAAPYKSLGFDYVNVAEVMAAKYPKGPKPIDVWNWWLEDVSSLQPGRFDAILADPITDLERGLTDWVNANPAHFGHTAGQYQSMSGIMWGDLKDHWKLILSTRVATKCQTFAFVAHLGDEFKGNKPSGKRQPKGKDTLIELSTLYLWLDRSKGAVPSAEVLKTRLSHLGMGPNGPEIRPALPPNLPVATPHAIRQYLLNPPDYANLRPEERIAEKVLSADERLRLQLQLAEAERDAAIARNGGAAPTTQPTPAPATSAPAASPPPPVAPTSTPPVSADALEENYGVGMDTASDEAALKKVGDEVKTAFDKGWIKEAHRDRLKQRFILRLTLLRTPSSPPPVVPVFDRKRHLDEIADMVQVLKVNDLNGNLKKAYGKDTLGDLSDEEVKDLHGRLVKKLPPKVNT